VFWKNQKQVRPVCSCSLFLHKWNCGCYVCCNRHSPKYTSKLTMTVQHSILQNVLWNYNVSYARHVCLCSYCCPCIAMVIHGNNVHNHQNIKQTSNIIRFTRTRWCHISSSHLSGNMFVLIRDVSHTCLKHPSSDPGGCRYGLVYMYVPLKGETLWAFIRYQRFSFLQFHFW
jgi:hypothetical protein